MNGLHAGFDDEEINDDEDWGDEDWDEDGWSSDDDEAEVCACPNCGADVYEDAVRCPHCGEYVTFSTAALAGRPWWWVATFLLGVVAVIIVLVRFA